MMQNLPMPLKNPLNRSQNPHFFNTSGPLRNAQLHIVMQLLLL